VASLAAEQIRVYILDDHDIVRRGLRDLLATARDIVVVGDSRSATGAAEMILALGTDVMVLDLYLQDGTGVDVCRAVRAADSTVKGLLLTASGDEEAAMATVLAGAAGYTTKYEVSDLLGAVRSVAAGRRAIEADATAHAAAQFLSGLKGFHPALTDAEQEILTLVADGRTDREIADRCGSGLSEISDQVTALIGRTTGMRARRDEAASGSPGGRHRRGAD
jgi:DNA-binding NarL/FixJ family response regulator